MSKHFLLTLHSKTLHSAFMNMKLSLLLFTKSTYHIKHFTNIPASGELNFKFNAQLIISQYNSFLCTLAIETLPNKLTFYYTQQQSEKESHLCV